MGKRIKKKGTFKMTLNEALYRWASRHAKKIYENLNDAEIFDWQDITNERLNIFKDIVSKRYAPNSARTFFAELKAVINKTDNKIDAQYSTILSKKADKPLKTYLDRDELARLEKVYIHSETERGVLYTFLISAYTGCRISDAEQLKLSNIQGRRLCYVSKKTAVKATIPCKKSLVEWIGWLENKQFHLSLPNYNTLLRDLCRRAKIDTWVTIFKAGRTKEAMKWECVSSHTGRISFATNLALLHTPIIEIQQMMGHSSPIMTSRYIIVTDVNLNEDQMRYFE